MKIIRAFFVIILSVLLSFVIGFFVFFYQIPTKVEDMETKADGLVVLTGGKGRVSEAVKLLSSGYGKRLLISGVPNKATIYELLGSIGYKHEFIEKIKDKIDIGYLATNTEENANEGKIWAEIHHFKSLRIITADFHITRSMAEFKNIAPEIKIIPNPVFNEKITLIEIFLNPQIRRKIFVEYVKYLTINFVSQHSVLKYIKK